MPPEIFTPGAPRLDLPRSFDERLGELCVLLDAGRDGKDVGVEDDVLRLPPVCDQQLVGALADVHLPLDGVGLALLVERHHDDARAVALDLPRVVEELVLALLEADRVDDPLPLQALEPGFEHGPARAVDHDRDARDVRFGREQVEERRHRLHRVEEVGVHVDVEDVRAAANLLERDLDRLLELAALDQAPEPRRARDVRPLADHDEVRLREDAERLEAAEPRQTLAFRDTSRGLTLGRGRDRLDVFGRGAAAAPDDVHQSVLGERAQRLARVLRLLIVRAHLVRETRIRVACHPRRSDAREVFHERAHLRRAE